MNFFGYGAIEEVEIILDGAEKRWLSLLGPVPYKFELRFKV